MRDREGVDEWQETGWWCERQQNGSSIEPTSERGPQDCTDRVRWGSDG